MKRSIVVALVIGLLAAMVVAPVEAGAAKKKAPKPRVYEAPYTCPCGIQANGTGPAWRLGTGEGGVQVAVGAKEKYRSVELTDDSGLPVYFSITQTSTATGRSTNTRTEPAAVRHPSPSSWCPARRSRCSSNRERVMGARA